MFCKNCGNKIQLEWSVCPQCGAALKENEKIEEKNSSDIDERIFKKKTRDEIKEELLKSIFQENGSVVICHGANGISKDLAKVLEPGEEILQFYHAFRNSVWGQVKSSGMFRNYMVCTNRRLIYIERIRPIAFRVFVFLKTTICIPYKEITDTASDKRIGIYSGKLIIESCNKKMNFAIINHKDAIELEEFLNRMKEK